MKTKMAAFGLYSDRRINKCHSLNLPVTVNGFTENPRLCDGWNGCKRSSFEANQSLLNNFSSSPSCSHSKLDWVKGDMTSFSTFAGGVKRSTNQSPIHASTSRDEAWLLLENVLTSAPHPSNSVLYESNLPYISPNKAIFTVVIPSTQILVVNSAACKLLNYSSDELCSMKLENLLLERHKHRFSTLTEAGSSDTTQIIFNNGKVVEFLNKEGNVVPVSLFLKKLDTTKRCLVIAETVDRRVAQLSIDKNGKILTCDEETAIIFQYDISELIGVDLRSLIPSVNLTKDTGQISEAIFKQKLTGRTKDGASFPLCLVMTRNPSQESWQIVLWIYSNLSGLIVLNKDLTISNCNHHFTKLLFGIPKNQLINENIQVLIPNFCEDLDFGREGTGTLYQSENSDSGSEKMLDSEVEKVNGKYIDDGASEDVSNTSCNMRSEEVSSKLVSVEKTPSEDNNLVPSKNSDYNFKVWSDKSLPNMKEIIDIKYSKSDDKMHSNCDIESAEISDMRIEHEESNKSIEIQSYEADSSKAETSKILESRGKDAKVKEGNFSGYGKHCDGTHIDIIYRVKLVVVNEKVLYCVWVSRDPWEVAEGGRNVHTNLTVTSSFNSTSLESSMTKDSYYSEQQTRPSSASIISQCDEILTAGEYSEHYTNLQQIGKGAFGYVKMAYRNSDGLLVITKFIKKQKINVRSWVVDPHLNMKVPLEISLLTTLEHPNIVEVLDVFHNESFFQLVMEKHGAGLDLFEFIDRKPKTDEKLNSYIFRQMVSAVHYLDCLGIVHRDIKDENVIINEKFQVKLIDFGSATFMLPDKMFSMFYGTVEYCSPEVLQGNKYKGPELEIWALGVTLYVLTFGENPFYDVEETIKGKFSIPAPISSQLFDLLHSMLEKDVDSRITIDKLIKNSWVNQPVDINNYQFENVLRCYNDEAYPPRYISEYCMEDRSENQNDIDCDRTVASSNSFCSLHTIENIDGLDHFDESFREVSKVNQLESSLHRLNVPPYALSSTPMKKNREGITKSAGSLHRTWENPGFPHHQSYENFNNNSIQKRFSLDVNILKRLTSVCKYPDEQNLLNEEQTEATQSEENTSSDLEEEIMKEFDKLKLLENGNNNGHIPSGKIAEYEHFINDQKPADSRKQKTESTGSDDSNKATCQEFYDSVDHRPLDSAEYECYWDAEDEKYDNDESY